MHDFEMEVDHNRTFNWMGIDIKQSKPRERSSFGGCRYRIEPTEPVEITTISGILICGRRAGNPFERIVRPS